MPLTDFLRTAVLLFGGAATSLAAVAVLSISADGNRTLIYVALGWWTLAGIIGLILGRRSTPSGGIERMLASARSVSALPEFDPPRLIVNRLWSLALFSIVCIAVAFLLPQVPAIGSGYALIVALAWRRQESAVAAIEGRDGVRFYIERTSPFKPTRVVRAPGLRKVDPPAEGATS